MYLLTVSSTGFLGIDVIKLKKIISKDYEELIYYFEQLNELGRNKVIENIIDLTYINIYRKDFTATDEKSIESKFKSQKE